MTSSMASSGARVRLSEPASSSCLATFLIGIIVGSISAYYGGVVDNIIMRIVDVFMTLPFILAALILAAVLTPMIGRS